MIGTAATIGAVIFALATGPAGHERWRPPELRVVPRVPASSPDELKEIALGFLGRPYRMGGVGSPAIDCSGFTCRVYAQAGYPIPRVSRDQANAGRPVPLDQIAAGDLLFFVGEPGEERISHVGLYLGDGELIHASSGQGKVVIAPLRSTWLSSRLVGARRLLPDPGAAGTSSTSTAALTKLALAETAPAVELEEHSGASVLPLMLRLPAKLADPSLGPELATWGDSALAIRAAGITERGVFGLVLAPEVTLRFESIALEVALALPLRLAVGEPATAGEWKTFADWTRLLRSAELGLRGADLELRLSRLGDATLAGGLLVDRLAPGVRAAGVPGLSVERSPLSFFGGLRTDLGDVQVILDDVVDPAIFATGVRLPVLIDDLRAGVAFATDQRAILLESAGGGRRSITGAEISLGYELVDRTTLTLELLSQAGLLHAQERFGAGVLFGVLAEHRFGAHLGSAITAKVHGGSLGGGFLAGLLGPTYAESTGDHLAALAESNARAELGAELLVRVGSVAAGGGWADGIGSERHALDRRLHLLVEISGIPLGSTRILDLRAAYASRGAFEGGDRDAVDVIHGSARLRLTSWCFAELYLEEGDRLEGGAGVTVAWIP